MELVTLSLQYLVQCSTGEPRWPLIVAGFALSFVSKPMNKTSSNINKRGVCSQVVSQAEPSELGEASVRCRDAACELVSAEVKVHQLLQVAQLGRHRPGQLLHAAQVQVGEGTQLAQLRRDRTCTCQTSLRIDTLNFELLITSVPPFPSQPGNLVRSIVDVGQPILLACLFLFGYARRGSFVTRT